MESAPQSGPEERRDVERFRQALEKHRLLDGVERLLVGCSGGSDSTALLLLVSEWARDGGPRAPQVIAGHVHHGLRGREADLDAAFVEALALRLGLPFLLERVQVSAAGRPAQETRAREVRYGVFRRWARERALDAIALAHHREDQQETVLLRICRGTGIAGLAGMRPSRLLEREPRPVKVIRPLLEWSREDLLAVLERRAQDFRTDASNLDLRIPRNRVRHEVLPLLEGHVHPGVRRALERLARQAADLSRDIDVLAERALAAALQEESEAEVTIRIEALEPWPPAVIRAILLAASRRVIGPRGLELTGSDLRSALELMGGESREGATVELPRRLGLARSRGALRLFRREPRAGRSSVRGAAANAALAIDGPAVQWEGWTLRAEREEGAPFREGAFEERVDEESLRFPLEVRGRRPGDRFWPLGAPGHMKLKEFLRQSRVPPSKRDRTPLVVAAGEIVWVVGQRIGHPFRIREATRRTIRLTGERSGNDPAC